MRTPVLVFLALSACLAPKVYVRVVDATGAAVALPAAAGRTPSGGGYLLDLGCDEFTAPGHLVTQRCFVDGETVTLARAVPVGFQCEGEDGAGVCPEGLYRCVAPGVEGFGRCAGEQCDCPDSPDALVVAGNKAWRAEVARVTAGAAVLRHTPPGTLTVTGPGACAAVAWRQLEGRRFIARQAECAGDVGTLVLPAGRYVVGTMPRGEAVGVEVRDVEVVPGQARTVVLADLAGEPVQTRGAARLWRVDSGATRWSLGADPAGSANVPAGARVTLRTPQGCCVVEDAQGTLACEAPTRAACGDAFEVLL